MLGFVVSLNLDMPITKGVTGYMDEIPLFPAFDFISEGCNEASRTYIEFPAHIVSFLYLMQSQRGSLSFASSIEAQQLHPALVNAIQHVAGKGHLRDSAHEDRVCV
jgi:hypothetical protein